MPKKMDDMERVMRHVKKTDDGHWLWIGSRCGMNREYGQVKYLDKTRIAHRVVWILHRGPIPGNLDLLHQCGQTLCVNPDHLKPGTEKENIQEAIDARGGKHWFTGCKRSNGNRTITRQD